MCGDHINKILIWNSLHLYTKILHLIDKFVELLLKYFIVWKIEWNEIKK